MKSNNKKIKLGELLFRKRRDSSLTLKEFCLTNEVPLEFISKLERNKLKITDNLIPQIIKIYDVTEAEIRDTDWEIDESNSFPAFLPKDITEEQFERLMKVIKDS